MSIVCQYIMSIVSLITFKCAIFLIEFNGDEFMDRYDSFTAVVNGKKIAKRLFIEEVIPESLLHYIEKEAPRAGNEKLRMHLARHSTQSDIRKLCKIMITTRGHPKMRSLGLEMLQDKELPPVAGKVLNPNVYLYSPPTLYYS